MRVQLLKQYMGHAKGSQLDVSEKVGKRLIADRFAKKLPASKIKTAQAVKG